MSRLTNIALRAMAEPAVANKPMRAATARIYTQFLFGRGWRFFRAQCRLASVGMLDIMTLPLPAGLQSLYPVLRPPLWQWRRARALPAITRGCRAVDSRPGPGIRPAAGRCPKL